MDRYAVFVDAGYYNVAASVALSGTTGRRQVRFDLARLARALADLGRALSEPASLLRVYWYDACPNEAPSSWHRTLADQANLKLRLGDLRGSPPRQKGVDTLLVHDLLVLAQERSISDAVLISGDEDMREAVVYAQERGVRVHLVVAAGSPPSWTLRQEADTVTTLMPEHFAPFTLPTHGPRAA